MIRARAELLLAQCDFSMMTVKLHQATLMCPGLETGVAPPTCSPGCAQHYLTFWETCGTLLQALGLRTMEYARLANTCTDTAFPRGSCANTCTGAELPCRVHEIKRACCEQLGW